MDKKSKKKLTHNKPKKMVSIKRKLITICILFAIIPLMVVNVISFAISKGALRKTSEKLTAELVQQVSVNVNNYVNGVEKSVTQFAVVDLIQKNLISDYTSGDTMEKVTATRNIERSTRDLKTMDKNIKSTALALTDDKLLGTAEQIKPEDLIKFKELKSKNGSVWIKGLGTAKEDVFFVKSFQTSSQSDQCTVIAAVNLDLLSKSMQDIELLEDSNLFITDDTGKMIYNKDSKVNNAPEKLWNKIGKSEGFGSTTIDKMLITYSVLPNGWRVVAEIPERSLTSQLDMATVSIWLLILIVGILAILIGTFISKSFSNPIINLMELMKRAEGGELTVQMTERGNDEIASLCISFNHMIANIRGVLRDTQAVISATLDDSKILHSSTEQSVETFDQLSLSIGDITQGTTQQAEDAQVSSVAMMSLAGSMQDVMQKTHAIFENNQGAKEMIQVATSSMELLRTTMTSSISAAGQIQDSILELSSLTKNIEDLMKLVDDISENTNLLALNASIEAARAGEVGKGFAVVAHEVRNLAEQSKASTINVRETLNRIEAKTKDTVDLVKTSKTTFTSQEEALKKVHQTFFNIIEILQSMDSDLGQVNDKVQNMRSLKDEMVHKIDNIATVTQESAASTEEVSALSVEQKGVIENLYELSNRLTEAMESLDASIKTFRVG